MTKLLSIPWSEDFASEAVLMARAAKTTVVRSTDKKSKGERWMGTRNSNPIAMTMQAARNPRIMPLIISPVT
jgi:hypothetical protein